MKTLLLALLLVAGSVRADPFLYAAPYPSGATQPDAVSFTINGGAPINCVLVSGTGGLQPKCDLVSITSPSTYTLVMTVSVVAGIVNTGTGAVSTTGASASSGPFSYQLKVGAVSSPVLRVGP